MHVGWKLTDYKYKIIPDNYLLKLESIHLQIYVQNNQGRMLYSCAGFTFLRLIKNKSSTNIFTVCVQHYELKNVSNTANFCL